jgi:hypothetical protein
MRRVCDETGGRGQLVIVTHPREFPATERYIHKKDRAVRIGGPGPASQIARGSTMTATADAPTIFVSHCSENRVLIESFAEWLRNSLSIPGDKIRITSVPGHKLKFGSPIPSSLREEIRECKAFVLLLTPEAKQRPAVLMEHGAAWAFQKKSFPFLTRGIRFSDLGFEDDRASLSMDSPQFEDDLKPWLADLASAAEVPLQGETFRDKAKTRFVESLGQLPPSMAIDNDNSPRAKLRKQVQIWANTMRGGAIGSSTGKGGGTGPLPAKPDQVNGHNRLVQKARALVPGIDIEEFDAALAGGHLSILGYTDTSVLSLVASAEMLAQLLAES